MFGDCNRPHTAQTALTSIKMNDSHCINQFIIKFDKWSTLLGYDEVALASTFYKVLLKCVKNLFVTMGQPNTLVKLHEQALRFDQRYWDRQMELQRAGLPYAEYTTFPSYNPGTTLSRMRPCASEGSSGSTPMPTPTCNASGGTTSSGQQHLSQYLSALLSNNNNSSCQHFKNQSNDQFSNSSNGNNNSYNSFSHQGNQNNCGGMHGRGS